MGKGNNGMGVILAILNIVFCIVLWLVYDGARGFRPERTVFSTAIGMLIFNIFLLIAAGIPSDKASSIWPLSEIRRRNLENKKRISELERDE